MNRADLHDPKTCRTCAAQRLRVSQVAEKIVAILKPLPREDALRALREAAALCGVKLPK